MSFKTFVILLAGLVFCLPVPSLASGLVSNLQGHILLQVEQRGEAWYVNPKDQKRYYMKDGPTAYEMMRKFGLGITDSDLKKAQEGDKTLLGRIKGQIVLQVQAHGEAFYVHPDSLTLYYLKDGEAAYTLMREKSLGITNANLGLIPAGQIVVQTPTATPLAAVSTPTPTPTYTAQVATPAPTPAPTTSVPEPAVVLPYGPAANSNPAVSNTSNRSASSSQDLQQQIADLQNQVDTLNNQLNPPPPPPPPAEPKPQILSLTTQYLVYPPDRYFVSWNTANTIACESHRSYWVDTFTPSSTPVFLPEPKESDVVKQLKNMLVGYQTSMYLNSSYAGRTYDNFDQTWTLWCINKAGDVTKKTLTVPANTPNPYASH
ncbi:MAG: FlxA-like family protein [Patescibacteria group bacterium]|nr:FlxA-like family protein [Patescibacteria group bacterium]